MSTLEVVSAVHGIAPRSNALHVLASDVSNGRAPESAFVEQAAQENEAWLELQQKQGIDLRSEARVDWPDYIRPVVEATTGFKEGLSEAPLYRWYETNTFYRRPTIVAPLALDGSRLPPRDASANLVSFVAPYTFAALCNNETALKAEELVDDLYEQLVAYYAGEGVSEIAFKEYGRELPEVSGSPGRAGFDQVAKLAEKYPAIRFSYLAAHRNDIVLPHDAPPNLGVSLTPSALQLLGSLGKDNDQFNGRDIWVPSSFAETTLEDTATEGEWDAAAIARIAPARIVLTNTVDYRHIPRDYADQKSAWLAEGARVVAHLLGGAK